MKKNAFTLIELIVVMSIMVIVSSTGIFYFFRQISSMKLSNEIEIVNDTIDNLDSKIDAMEILDYSIEFKKSDKIGFVYSENNLGINCRQNLNMNYLSHIGILSTNCPSGENYEFKIYGGIKFQKKQIIEATQNFDYDFGKKANYTILGYYTGTVLNNINIKYYSKDNILNINENKLILTNINSNSSNNGISYNSVEIKNLNGKKSIIANSTELDKIYLFFEREGIEKFVEIKK